MFSQVFLSWTPETLYSFLTEYHRICRLIDYSGVSLELLPMSQNFRCMSTSKPLLSQTTWHSLHKMASFCAAPLHKGVHFFEILGYFERGLQLRKVIKERSISWKWISNYVQRDLQLCKICFKEVKESMEGGQHYLEWYALSIHLPRLWYALKCWCKCGQRCLHTGWTILLKSMH